VKNMAKQKEFKKIVLAVDGSNASKKAAKKAFSLAKDTDIDVTAIHVVHVPAMAVPSPHTAYMGDIAGSMKKQGQSILDDIVKMGSDKGIKVDKKLVEGIPDDEIIKSANKNDLIVMGSKGHSTIGRILVGSVSEKVLHHSDATVMIVR
jgi:nucleotide-binding universal stress UspA family protein